LYQQAQLKIAAEIIKNKNRSIWGFESFSKPHIDVVIIVKPIIKIINDNAYRDLKILNTGRRVF
jgi:hypothetical protein